MTFAPFCKSLLLYFLLFACTVQASIDLYCVKHRSDHVHRNSLDTCSTSRHRPVSAAALADSTAIKTAKNELSFDLICIAKDAECAAVKATIAIATEIISAVFQFEMPLTINASYVSFCQEYSDCHPDSKMASIGQAYPSISYIMVDQTDNMTRMYPQPLLKQYTKLKVKPNWLYYDINAQFNNEINWYFASDPSPIQDGQTDFLRNVLHELIHGLGFMTAWNDDLYYDLLPLFPNNLDYFITPLLLASADNDQQMSNYNSPQPFWGFVEFPFDKFIFFNTDKTPGAPTYSFTSVTQKLNEFCNSNITFRSMIDLANAWFSSNAFKQASKVYSKTVNALNVLAMVDNELLLWLETSVDPFSSGSSLCHVDQSEYLNTTEYLMVYTANRGIGMSELDQLFPFGPIGPKLAKLMASLGYQLDPKYAINATRPDLKYWGPSPGLSGAGSNTSPSLSINTDGPARLPPSSTNKPSSSVSTPSAATTFTLNHFIYIIILIAIFPLV